jgi:hypothetical protein
MLNDRFETTLALLRRPWADSAADVVVKAAAVLAFLYLLAGYIALPSLPVFGHDEVHYYSDFYFKLVEDGRWLDYLLHDFLRSIPLPIWSLVYVALWWSIIYRIARACVADVPYAALVTSTALLASPFVEMSLWPASVVPALLAAWLAILMQRRGIAYPFIYVVSGMLMFGAMQTMYFMLPLLFLPQLLDSNPPARSRSLLLLKHMLWWVAGSVAGVLLLCVMLWLLAGIYFPQPAEWRTTRPIVDASSLLANIRYVIASFTTHLETLLRQSGVTWGFILTVAAVALLRIRALLAQTPALLSMSAVLISFFVFSIPLAPVIHPRSLIAMAAVVILFLALLPGTTAVGRVLGAVLLIKLSFHSAQRSQDYLEAQRAETAVFMHELRDLFPGYPMAYTALALYGTMDPARPEARRFNDGSLMHPLMMSLGVESFLDCKIPKRCDNVGVGGEPISVLPFAGGQLELSVTPANIGIIRYRE